jgi:hypothetical protein
MSDGRGRLSELLHARAFKGVLLDADIAAREERGELPRARDPRAQAALLGKYEDFFSREMQDGAEKMAYVYGLFYCFENLVRDLVSQRLAERKGPKWWNHVPDNVKRRVEQKRKDAEKNRWHQAVYQANIDLTLFGDMASIIVKEWQEFEDLFPSQHWIKQRFDELERSRNVIAHANLLPDAEIERLEQYLDDWLRQVP